MSDNDDEVEDCVSEGLLDGIFAGFRNYDTIFKIQGGGAWRQDEYLFEYHYLYSPKAKVFRVLNKKDRKETFYIQIEGIKTRVQVKYAYL